MIARRKVGNTLSAFLQVVTSSPSSFSLLQRRAFSPSASFALGHQHSRQTTTLPVQEVHHQHHPVPTLLNDFEAFQQQRNGNLEEQQQPFVFDNPSGHGRDSDLANQMALKRGRLGGLDFTDPATYSATTRPPHEAFTLLPASYTSQEFYDVEEKQVFGKSWVCVGLVDEVRNAGDTVVADIGGQPIFVVRDKTGSLNGFFNVCRHRGSKLIRENGRYPVVHCKYHRWGYSLDGRLLATPLWDTVEGGQRVDKEGGKKKRTLKGKRARIAEAQEAANQATKAEALAEANAANGPGCSQMQGIMEAFDVKHIKAFDKRDFSLFSVRTETFGPFVFATLASESEVPSLKECLGDLPTTLQNYPLDELVSVRKKEYSSKANWKLLVENFEEYYHLPSVHPSLCLVSSVDNHHRRQGPGQYVGFVTEPLTKGGTPIDPEVIPDMKGITNEEKLTGHFHHLFPNAFWFLLPSHIFTVRLVPKGPGLTIEHADLLVHPDLLEDAQVKKETEELNAKLDAMMDFYDMTNMEDIEACELVQEGVRVTKYEGGRVSYRFEETIHRFQNMLIDYMVGKPGRIPKGNAYYIGGQPDEAATEQLVEQPQKNTVGAV